MKEILSKLESLKLDNRQMIFAGIISLLILYVDITFVMKIQWQAITSLAPRITKVRKDIDNLNRELARLRDLKNRQVKPQTLEGPSVIISEDQVPLLLQEVSDLANSSKVKITQINTVKDAKAQDEVIAGEKLSPLLIKLELSCNYHSLVVFLDTLEDISRFIEIQEIKIVRSPGDYFVENINLTLKTYVQK